MKNHLVIKKSFIKLSLQKVMMLTALFLLVVGTVGIPEQAAYAREGQPPDPKVMDVESSASVLAPALDPPNCTTPPNEIVAENCLPGNPPSEWDVSGAGDANIQGYATDISVNQGGTVHFKVDTNATAYHIDIYRMGYYGGNGARKITTISPSASLPQIQPACLFDATNNVNLLDCGNWAESASWVVPATATSGIYIAKLVRDDATAGASHITFIVRDDDGASDLLFQTSDTTWQAYNGYGGYSLYAHPNHAHKVSYNRPFLTRTNSTEDFWFNSEYPMIRWLERNGYDVSYFTDVDSHRNGSEILEHKVFMSVGHDEYWSAEQRSAVEAARAAGVNLAFFSGNSVYWKTRWENSTDGSNTPYRTLVSYKEGSLAGSEHYDCQGNFACDPNPTTWTGLWRDGCSVAGHDGCKPENSLMGTISWMGNTDTIQVSGDDGNMRFWRNTPVAALPPASTISLTGNSLGYEWDFEQAQYQNSYPDGRFWVTTTNSAGQTHHMSLYRAISGALVFGAGTVQWPWGLDGNHDRGASTEDANMQQATVNLFADMGVQPTSLQTGLVAATASTDSTAPTASIVSPITGTDAPSGSTVTISGTAADTGGVVAAVELSFDGGTTWITATGRESWSYNWIPGTAGTPITIVSRAIDDSGNIGSVSASITLNVVERVCPCSIWNDTIVPTNAGNDGQPIEIGVKFQSSEDGYITGLRFYKDVANTGTHTGHLWTSTGVQLADATFVGETASGWQEVYFSTPVQITANTTYVASYHSSNGGYSYGDAYFATAYDSAPLRALANGEDGPNGVYNYGASSFPTQTYNSSNYWVDVIFDPTPQVYSIWNDTTIPANPAVTDGRPIELGVKFKSAVPGKILGVRFYKGAANTGTHVGHLWSSSGTQLAGATFTSETASGWQNVLFSTPVSITANTTYVASYFSASGYFAINAGNLNTAFDNPPLRALANGEDGPNAVYRYDTTGFPTSNGGGSNYWVDVLFAPDTPIDNTAPTVTSVTPLNGASNIGLATTVTAAFSEGMAPLTITNATFELRDASNNLVPATVSYNAGTRTATLTPTSALTLSSSYTARVIGGASGVTDVAGNSLASNYTWTFSTLGPPPNEGPGGPILVLSSAANPFSRYYAEILRAEGLNEFTATDISNLTGALLNNYQVVVLGEMTLTPAEVGLITNWVNGGGNLIAMRPDPQLAGLLSLSSAGTTLSNGYLLVNTASAPGAGIVNQTIQFHGVADRYTLNGATSIATLYSNSTTSTTNPAVTIVSVGSSGGQAAAFTYDLARSVVYTRQGNPAWAGQSRDGQSGPIRSDNLFFGNAAGDPQPDWVDFNKVQIPQADEQQRLLANMILSMNADKNPLPRFWYFPRGEKAVVVMTHDEHGGGDIVTRLNSYNSLSPSGCNVNDWECVRATTYMYTNAPITNAQVSAFQSQGYEFAVHTNTGCANFTPASLANDYATQIPGLALQFPSLNIQTTNRTHCIAFSDWSTQPKVQLDNGMRFDTNYYYWPPSWIQDRPGMFTGSGMPMRFADLDGTMIDVYQATTQMTDESGQSFPYNIDVLLDNAVGAAGYYGAFTANMHTDGGSNATNGALAIVASAQARSVPVVTAKQMLNWVDGRNLSAFSGITWNGNALDFHVSVGANANGLYAMLPTQSNAGPLLSITRNGSPVTYTTSTIKGVEYANFLSPGGDYQAIYSVDTIPPVISNIVSTVNGDGTVTITWNTDEASDSRVDFGTASGTLNLNSANAALATTHTITLTGLTPNTTYYFRVTSADASANPATSPVPPATLNFTTPSGTLTDTIPGDFSGGNLSCAYPTQNGNGELILPPTIAAEFNGFVLPAGWSSNSWTGGTPAVSGGVVTLNGVSIRNDTLLNPGTSLEFVATFTGQSFQHVGFGGGDTTFNDSPWIMFSTSNDGTQLFARILATAGGPYNAGDDKIALGAQYLGSPHLYRIDWNANSVNFSIDGVNVLSRTVTINTQMRAAASDYNFAAPTLVVDWMHVSPYISPCTFTSRVFDAGQAVNWETMSWTGQTPAATSFAFVYRTGNTPTPDGTWTPFQPVLTSGSTLSGNSRYIQYQVVLATTNAMTTPVLEDVSITYSIGADTTPPTISGRNPAPNAVDVDETGNITVTFSEPMNPATIIPANFSLKLDGTNTNVPFTLTYAGLTATLNPNSDLALGTQYAVHVAGAVADLVGNPLGTNADWTFVTRVNGLIDTTVPNFGSGTNACYISQTANGELILNPTVGTEFSGASLPAGWTSTPWTGGTSTVSGGQVVVDGAAAYYSAATFTPGRSLEFVATFTASSFEHVGLLGAPDFGGNWAIFSTNNTTTQLFARTSDGTNTLIPGTWLGTPHRYRIDWTATSAAFYIDDIFYAQHNVALTNLRPAISEYNIGGQAAIVDWMRLSPYGSPCAFESRVFDAGSIVDWLNLNWIGSAPAGTNAAFETRTGNTPTPDGTWSAWQATSGPIASPNGQYAQYRVTLSTTNVDITPVIQSVELTYMQVVNQAPTNLALTPSSLAENLPAGTVVGAFSTTDPDALDTFTYSLVTNASACPLAVDNASFSINAANLVTTSAFDYETKNSYIICARGTDSGGLFFDKQLTVAITDVVNATTTSLTSDINPSLYGQTVTFTATVTSGAGTPTGTVTFMNGATTLGTGTLNASGVATFSTNLLTVSGSPYTIQANYGGSGDFGLSTNSVVQTVNKATATVTLSNLNQTYTGAPLSATATTVPPALTVGLTYNGLPAAPTNAGSYAVVATINDPNYSGTANGTLVIAPAASTTTVSGGGTFTYNGNPRAATVTVTGVGGLNLTPAPVYSGSCSAAPVNVSQTPCTASYNYTGDLNHLPSSDTATITITPASATVTLGSLTHTYDGTPKSATAITNPSGLSVSFTYNGSPTPPTNAGSYTVVGTITDSNYTGTANGTLTISKATAAVSLGNLNPTYDGTPKSATAITTPAGLTVTFTYDGSATAPTNAGTYAVIATVVDLNYNGSANGTLVIGKATAPVTLGNLNQTYDGTPRSVSVTTVPSALTVDVTYNGAPAIPTNAGTYAIVATVNDANYSGSANGTLIVDKAAATVILGNLNQTYNGTPRAITAITLPVSLTVDFTYDGSATAPTNAGTYAVTGTINSINYSGTASGSLVVNKAPATVTLSNLSQNFDGTPKSVTVTTVPAGLTVDVTYDGSPTAPTNANSYAVVATVNETNYSGTANGTLIILNANATVTLGNLTHTYDGTPKSATATTVPAGLTVDITYDGLPTPPTNAGTYAVVATINDVNYAGTISGSMVIAKAGATVTLGSLAQTYNGLPKSATATTSPSGLAVTFTYDGSPVPPTNAGTYTVVATVNDTNYTGSATDTLVIGKATAAVTLSNLNQTYDGTPKPATAVTVPAGLTVDLTYDGSVTPPTNVGSYAVVATVNDPNYNGSTNGTLVIAKATAVVNLGGLAQTYDGTPKSATATTTPVGLTVDLTYDGSAIAPSAAGNYLVVGTVNDPNYGGSASATLVISPATATVTLGNLNQTYDGNQLSVTVSTVPVGLSVNITYNGSAVAPTNANSYAVLATVNDPNYSGTANGTFIIAPAASTTTVTGGTFVYDGGTHPASVTVTGIGGLSISPAPVYSGACSAAPVNVSDTPCTASYNYGGDANHTGSSGNATITITPAAASVSVTGGIFAFDTNPHPATGFAYGVGGLPDTLLPAPTITYTGSGSTSYGPSNVPPVAAGTYNVLASFAGNANYQPASASTTITINSLTLNITAENKSIAFGDTDPVFTFQYSGFLGTDDASVLTTEPVCSVAGVHTNVGSYTIVCSGGVDDNYGFNYIDGTLTVGKSILTVTADNQAIKVGDADPAFTFQYSGFKGVDDASVLTAEPVCSVAVPHTNAGTYPITCSGGADDNYSFNYVAGTLSVNGAPIVSANGVATDAGPLANFQIVGTGITQFLVTFSEDVFNVASTDLNYNNSVINPANYMLVRDNGDGFQTVSCALGVSPADTYITVDSVTYSNNGGAGPFIATLNVNSSLPLSNGNYRFYVCGTTSITDANDITLKLAGDGVTPGTDFLINFTVQLGTGGGNTGGTGSNKDQNAVILSAAGLIPVTGFAPGQVTALPTRTKQDAYTSINDLRLEIPALSIDQPIAGIPFKNNGWDVTWLGDKAGYLEGSAYPTWTGNTVLTGHATDPNGNLLSFGYIKELKANDIVMIHSNGFVYIYQVRQNRLIASTSLAALFKHENYDWITLVTCENYNEDNGTFTSRRIVRAVLISVLPDK
ncbi:MAG: sortase [Anaerolineales bacterium]